MTTPVENLARKPEPCVAPQLQRERSVGKNILVVDDDPPIREALRKVLQAGDYAVALAADGREAIEKFNTERIDLVLLDLNLPVNSGWDIFGTLTALDPVLPIIIITGRQNQSELAAATGISALMEKPLNVPLLLQTIVALLAEEPEMRLKRLVGLRNDLRYAPPFRPASTELKASWQTDKLARPARRGINTRRKPN